MKKKKKTAAPAVPGIACQYLLDNFNPVPDGGPLKQGHVMMLYVESDYVISRTIIAVKEKLQMECTIRHHQLKSVTDILCKFRHQTRARDREVFAGKCNETFQKYYLVRETVSDIPMEADAPPPDASHALGIRHEHQVSDPVPGTSADYKPLNREEHPSSESEISSSMEKTFCKVTTTAKKACYLLTTLHDHGQEGVDISISDGTSAWSGSLSEDDLDKLAVKIKMDYNSFISQTVQAFTGKSSKHLTFQYQMKVIHDDAIEFSWKKFVPDEDIKLGSMVLLPNDDPGQVVCQIFDYAVSSMSDSGNRIMTLEAENNKLSQERSNALKRLEKCVSAKEDLEKDLYSKFVAVLNSKKEKIRQLKRNLDEGGFGSSGGEPVPSTSKSSAATPKDASDEEVNNGIADIKHESGSEVNTDDEAATPKRKGRSRPKGQGHQKGQGAATDDSLILDDVRDTAVEGSVVIRPTRQRGGNKKQTPSKPVLPKASSGSKRKASDESLDSAKKSSLRKGRSDQSNRSSDKIDADDLFDDL